MKQPASRRMLTLPPDAAQFAGLRQQGTASKLVRGWEQALVLQAKGRNYHASAMHSDK